jgi:hypothetical protein
VKDFATQLSAKILAVKQDQDRGFAEVASLRTHLKTLHAFTDSQFKGIFPSVLSSGWRATALMRVLERRIGAGFTAEVEAEFNALQAEYLAQVEAKEAEEKQAAAARVEEAQAREEAARQEAEARRQRAMDSVVVTASNKEALEVAEAAELQKEAKRRGVSLASLMAARNNNLDVGTLVR